MLRSFFTIIFFVGLPFIFHSVAQNCDTIIASGTVSSSSMRVGVLAHGNGYNSVWKKKNDSEDGSVDGISYTSLIKSMNIWSGGQDPVGNVSMVAEDDENKEWIPGPIGFEHYEVDKEFCDRWNKVFSFTKDDIRKAIQVYEKGLSCDEIPDAVKYWPVESNPYTAEYFKEGMKGADFYDRNIDDIYNPCDGDLPIVPFTNQLVSNLLMITPDEVSFYILSANKYYSSNFLLHHSDMKVYVFTFNNQEAEDITYWIFETQSIDYDILIDHYLLNRIDFDLGCPENDFVGSIPSKDLVYAYNDPDNSMDCDDNAEGKTMVGFSVLQGGRYQMDLAIVDGKDTMLNPLLNHGFEYTSVDTYLASLASSSILIPSDCEKNPSECVTKWRSHKYNILSGKRPSGEPMLNPSGEEVKYDFSGNPAKEGSWSMCNHDVESTSLAYMSSGGGPFYPGEKKRVVMAAFTAEVDDACPDEKNMIIKYNEAKRFLNRNFHSVITPEVPSLFAKVNDGKIELELADIPYGYNKSSGFHSCLGCNYEFEGVKIFQVSSPDFDMSLLGNEKYSHLVYQGDIENGVSSISNFKQKVVDGEIVYVVDNKVDGEDKGINENVITLDYDFLRDRPIDEEGAYYFVALSYAYNDYIDELNNVGGVWREYQYLESNFGLVVETAKKDHREPLVSDMTFKYFNAQIELGNIVADVDFSLYHVDGQLLFEESIPAQSRYDISLLESNMTTGIYLCAFYFKELNETVTFKVFVQ